MPKLPKITSLLFFLQYLKKEVRDKADFVHADKHERFLQIDTMIFDGDDQAFQSSQNSKFVMSLQILKKKLEVKLIFYMRINIKYFFKLMLLFLVCVARHAQITQNNKFVISLQCLKKEVSDEVDF